MLETFTALAEPSRLRIVDLLLSGPRSVGAIGEALALSQPQVSKHLRVLKTARLVAVEPRAQQRLYGLSPEPLRELSTWLERYRRIWDERFAQLDDLLSELTASRGAHPKHPKPPTRPERPASPRRRTPTPPPKKPRKPKES